MHASTVDGFGRRPTEVSDDQFQDGKAIVANNDDLPDNVVSSSKS